ncbi:molybdenum cofactor guanylyltransferase [cf. Phormidesmis sp. LEGE 11477]|uniref:molybdenum cofactor guanylyltransferase n=1 Tax=cf. Phormidesmis sp. LEGE 11477 TaxID=1828680 RepID=UPI0018819BC1|nr:molybdenum cofactor guanylyltransferase [cf. Phormidesmis sp. LEGE 11477]MBE9063984.1 molybdenum cofactor guanylyltransferase [cf. Phormidesmis sp. LEGE 11477]
MSSSAITSVTPTLSVMVLAGGRSSRMGKDKALLPTENGQPLLLKTVQVAQSLATEVVIVTPWPERYRDSIPDSVTFLKEPSPSDPADLELSALGLSAGPLNGFSCGWHAIASDWCLLLACDLPYLDSAIMQRWWAWLTSYLDQTSHPAKKEPAPTASLTPGPKGWEPLCGYYHRRCIPSLTQHLQSGQHSFQSWLSKISVVPYQAVPERMLFNCNTPTDWVAVNAPYSTPIPDLSEI